VTRHRRDRPPASSELVSSVMKRVRSKNTGPEVALRKLLFAAGARFRVQYRPKGVAIGRSTIDIAFVSKKLAIFVDGCFWHGCPEHGAIPKANREWWAEKLRKNRERDEKVTEILTAAGWTVLRFWTHHSPEYMSVVVLEHINFEERQ